MEKQKFISDTLSQTFSQVDQPNQGLISRKPMRFLQRVKSKYLRPTCILRLPILNLKGMKMRRFSPFGAGPTKANLLSVFSDLDVNCEGCLPNNIMILASCAQLYLKNSLLRKFALSLDQKNLHKQARDLMRSLHKFSRLKSCSISINVPDIEIAEKMIRSMKDHKRMKSLTAVKWDFSDLAPFTNNILKTLSNISGSLRNLTKFSIDLSLHPGQTELFNPRFDSQKSEFSRVPPSEYRSRKGSKWVSLNNILVFISKG